MKYPPTSGEAQLFDLKADPNETTNLAGKKPELVKELSALLDEWYVPEQRQAGKFRAAEPKPKKPARGKGPGKA